MTFLKSLLLGGALALATLAPARAQDAHIISLQDADIREFIDDVSVVTGRGFIVDPRVQGKVTIASEQALTSAELFSVFKEVMRVHGYTAIRTPTGEYRITLLQGSAQDAPLTTGNGIYGQMNTAIIKMRGTDAANAARLVKPVMHSQGQVAANPQGSVLVVTDFPENINKARAIVSAMESDGLQQDTIQLRQLSVVDAQEALSQLAGQNPRYRIAALPATNQIIVEGPPEDVARIRQLLSTMDVGSITPRGAVSVVPLRFANGADLIELMAGLLPSYVEEGRPAPTVAYEPGSNSIVISASGETQQELSGLIRRLDVRRPQVLVEALIVEISDTAASELGVQFGLAGLNGSTVPLVSTNFSRSAPNLLALTGALGGPGLGLSDGVTSTLETAAVNSITGLGGASLGVGGTSGDTLFAAIINAVETDDDSNVLSTPFVTTLDNAPATFLVGQEIPITTGEVLGTANVNPFRTFERKEVGIQLDVLPQISEGDVIRLEISQEVSSVAGVLTSAAGDFVTNKRQIETTVLANDGEIIVLGGLLQDDEQINIEKVPVLGDLPGIGAAFRSKGKSRAKTNLMVFLRPTIIRDAQDARLLTQDRLNRMRIEDVRQSGREISKIDQLAITPLQ